MSPTIPVFDASYVVPRRDPRTMNWPLAGNMPFLFTVIITYLYIVKFGGPRFMKGRKPYDGIKPLILVYNLAMVFLNAYFCINILTRSYLGGGYQLTCQGIDFEAKDRTTMEFLELCWWYFWVRIADLIGTVFFVLRKKDTHVSLLHVVHHILVVFNGWYGLAYGFDGQAALSIVINCFIHFLMYSYYFLSLFGSAVRPYLWWKRYLTRLQLVQFVIIFVHIMIPFFKECGYPKGQVLVVIPQTVFFFTMFVHFYLRAYGNTLNTFQAKRSQNKVH